MLNVVLGTGPLTLPYAFNEAGFLLGAVFLALVMGLSFITATFVIEGLAMANRLKHGKGKLLATGDDTEDSDLISSRSSGSGSSGIVARGLEETWMSPLLSQASRQESQEEIVERFEIGKIAEAVMPRHLCTLSYSVLIIYAYGVLTVYVISGCTSLAKQVGTIWGIDAYYPTLCCFVLFVSPICLLDFQKTRPLQVGIGMVRLFSVLLMIVIMARHMTLVGSEDTKETRSEDEDDSKFDLLDRTEFSEMPLWRPQGLPALFGNAAFIFMIHHSIPGLVFPLRRHKDSFRVIAWSYFIGYTLYLILCLLALLSFGSVDFRHCKNKPSHRCEIQGLFNTNFASYDYRWAAEMLLLYPLLVVSVFPLVAITLRNNLKAFLGAPSDSTVSSPGHHRTSIRLVLPGRNVLYTLLAVGPPYLVAAVTRDVQVVMKYIGGYFGLALMFLVPSLINVYSRREAARTGLGLPRLQAPIGGKVVVGGVLLAFAAAVIFDTSSFLSPSTGA